VPPPGDLGAVAHGAPAAGVLDLVGASTEGQKERAAADRAQVAARRRPSRRQRINQHSGGRGGPEECNDPFWPETQAMLYLKQRSRVFSIHANEALLKDPSVPRQPIFAARSPTLREPAAARPPVLRARPDVAP
jgi:hypothetical protein